MGSRPVVFKTQWRTLPDPSAAPSRGARHQHHLQPPWWMLPDPPAVPPRGPAIDVVFKTWWRMLPDPPAAPPRSPTIDDISNLGGGHYRTHRQHPQGARHQRSLQNSVVDAIGPTGNTPRGSTINVVFKPWWWTLPDLPATPLRGLAIDVVFKFSGGRYRTHRHCPPPQGAHHRCHL
jgi:hypothetical protein